MPFKVKIAEFDCRGIAKYLSFNFRNYVHQILLFMSLIETNLGWEYMPNTFFFPFLKDYNMQLRMWQPTVINFCHIRRIFY